MSSHALLSPSAASRWLACTPSARLEEKLPDTTSEAAAEGTLAHALGEALIRRSLAGNRSEKIKHTKEIARIEKEERYTPAMRAYAEDYATFVLERYNEAKVKTPDAVIAVEQKLDMSEYVPDGYGTGDAVIIADGTLSIIDLKYGKGVPVSSENNPQMKLYALGALAEFGFLYGIDTVSMTIFQPRIDNTSTWEISVDDLYAWGAQVVKPRATMAYNGEGEAVPGAHCRFCRAKALCKANADKNLELAKYDFADAALLSEADIADILSRADAFTNWLKAVQDYALTEAVEHGTRFPGYKLVEGRSTRTFSDPDSVFGLLIKEGYDEAALYERKPLPLTGVESLLGKKEFAALLADYVVKPPGKPALVPLSDKRPEINSNESAKADFSNQ